MREGTLARLDIDPPALHRTVLCLHVQAVGQVVVEEAIVAISKSSKSFRL